jgi:hypothetical protein
MVLKVGIRGSVSLSGDYSNKQSISFFPKRRFLLSTLFKSFYQLAHKHQNIHCKLGYYLSGFPRRRTFRLNERWKFPLLGQFHTFFTKKKPAANQSFAFPMS